MSGASYTVVDEDIANAFNERDAWAAIEARWARQAALIANKETDA